MKYMVKYIGMSSQQTQNISTLYNIYTADSV